MNADDVGIKVWTIAGTLHVVKHSRNHIMRVETRSESDSIDFS